MRGLAGGAQESVGWPLAGLGLVMYLVFIVLVALTIFVYAQETDSPGASKALLNFLSERACHSPTYHLIWTTYLYLILPAHIDFL